MKVLWITNIIFPAVCEEIKLPSPVTGGWMYSSAKSIIELGNIRLGVATTYSGNELKSFRINGIDYYLIPKGDRKKLYSKRIEDYWKETNEIFRPDIVHIHGSEHSHGLAYVNACGSENVVVSIQGMVSVYERYYYGSIPEIDLLKNITIRDFLRFDSIFSQRQNMRNRGSLEQTLIKKVRHVIGRTEWDKAHVWSINSKIDYHFCNETLRDEFYKYAWSRNSCERYSIFLSQAHYPIKGLHQVLKALPLILREYPSTKVYVAGENFFCNRKKIRMTGYARYIKKIVKENDLMNNIIFTGLLSEKEMCSKYLNSHVFVCPSSIENSPNSLGEAQLLGVPVVSSFVGGTPDMVKNLETGMLYRFEEIEMLAKLVCEIFKSDDLARSISKNERIEANKRHSVEQNTKKLYSIYEKLCKS